MTHNNHRTYSSWFFGIIILAFMFGVFFLAPDELPPFKQQLLAFIAALLGGIFGFFITGVLTVTMQHKKSNTKLNAASGMALFVIVLGWWNSPVAPVTVAETEQQPTRQISEVTTVNNAIDVKGGANIHTSGEANSIIQTGNGQIQQGTKIVNSTVEKTVAPQSNTGINIGGNLVIESTGLGNTTIQSGNGQIQQVK